MPKSTRAFTNAITSCKVLQKLFFSVIASVVEDVRSVK